MKRHLLALACASALLAGLMPAHAGGNTPLRYELRDYAYASPAQRTAGTGGAVVSHVVQAEGAPWIRLMLKDVKLAPGSRLRITSLEDGAQQHLNARTLREWRNTTAYFNGPAVRVELLAAPGSRGNRFGIAKIVAGKAAPDVGTESQCGPQDNRVPSSNPQNARLIDVGCTANLMANGCFTTAGHCMSSPSLVNVVEFNVPNSTILGTLRHPAPRDQYVPTSNRQFRDGGLGNDWGVFTVAPNTETGLTPLQAQGPGINLSTTLPLTGATADITGYGTDSGTANQTQQYHFGPITAVNTGTNRLLYQADTEGGNSGSAVMVGGTMAAIHTNAGCTTGGSGANSGTLYTNSSFQSAFASVCTAAPPLPSCGDITRVRGSCSASGTITATITLADSSHNGQTMTFTLDGTSIDVPIVGNTATLSDTGNAAGPHTVGLVEPAGCGAPRTITCR